MELLRIAAPIPLIEKKKRLAEGIFRWIRQGFRLIVGKVFNAQKAEQREKRLAAVRESDCTVMRILLLNQHMTVEAVHLRNGEDADAAKAAGRYVQNLALCNVGLEFARGVALQTEEGDVARL